MLQKKLQKGNFFEPFLQLFGEEFAAVQNGLDNGLELFAIVQRKFGKIRESLANNQEANLELELTIESWGRHSEDARRLSSLYLELTSVVTGTQQVANDRLGDNQIMVE